MEQDRLHESEYPQIGIYEHYKSTPESLRYYQVIGFARHTETEEIVVVYIPLYIIPEHTGLRMQVRPLTMLTEEINHNDQMIPRFRYIGQEL